MKKKDVMAALLGASVLAVAVRGWWWLSKWLATQMAAEGQPPNGPDIVMSGVLVLMAPPLLALVFGIARAVGETILETVQEKPR